MKLMPLRTIKTSMNDQIKKYCFVKKFVLCSSLTKFWVTVKLTPKYLQIIIVVIESDVVALTIGKIPRTCRNFANKHVPSVTLDAICHIYQSRADFCAPIQCFDVIIVDDILHFIAIHKSFDLILSPSFGRNHRGITWNSKNTGISC